MRRLGREMRAVWVRIQGRMANLGSARVDGRVRLPGHSTAPSRPWPW